jgi:hypothetical protein
MQLLVFGGVSDVDEGDHLESTFYNDLHSLDLESGRWEPLVAGTSYKPSDEMESSSESEGVGPSPFAQTLPVRYVIDP